MSSDHIGKRSFGKPKEICGVDEQQCSRHARNCEQLPALCGPKNCRPKAFRTIPSIGFRANTIAISRNEAGRIDHRSRKHPKLN